jgi:hypothetical protein
MTQYLRFRPEMGLRWQQMQKPRSMETPSVASQTEKLLFSVLPEPWLGLARAGPFAKRPSEG